MVKNVSKKMQENRDYWESQARKHAGSFAVSWEDKNMINLEIGAIRPYIKNGHVVLDAGCSNGYSTFKINEDKGVIVKAFDTSKTSIKEAKKNQAGRDIQQNISFSEGDILNIDEPDNAFDVAYTIRVLINLPTWDLQQQAIKEMHRVLKTGGIYLLSEAFIGSLKKLNELRKLANLPPLTPPKFNLYLEENALEHFVSDYFEIIEVKKFSSIYYAASRFLRYLTMDTGTSDTYDNKINNFFAPFKETRQSGDFGIQKLYVLKKHGLN